ncbi:hypothetical protein ACTWP5_21430 [Streptomyces sp. 4N509B]|uniref:hypothetical protein n=1 Tax=Streptomyces sp. 4N509B TaxID=3457413 RepID=UPI003FD6ACAA
MDLLSSAGVRFVLDPDRLPDTTPGNHGNATFPWDEVAAALLEHRDVPAPVAGAD